MARARVPAAAALALLISGAARVAPAQGEAELGPFPRARQPDEARVSVGLAGGRVRYREDFSVRPEESDWAAPLGAVSGQARIRAGPVWLIQGAGTLWASGTEREQWSAGPRMVQRNTMQVRGADWLAEVGGRVTRDPRTEVVLLGGGSARALRFERRDFQRVAGEPDPTLVTEDVTLFALHGALEWRAHITPALAANGRASVGAVLSSKAENSYFGGTILGEGGVVTALRAGLAWTPAAGQEVFVRGLWERQDLRGGTEYRLLVLEGELVPIILEWPDNELDRWAIEAGWALQL